MDKKFIDAGEAAEIISSKLKIDIAELVDVMAEVPHHEPTCSVQEVKHGKWVYNPDGHDYNLGAWECSLCHTVNNNLSCRKEHNPYLFRGSNYCPNCGARMDKKDDGLMAYIDVPDRIDEKAIIAEYGESAFKFYGYKRSKRKNFGGS